MADQLDILDYTGDCPESGFYKCRVVYGREVCEVVFSAYTMRTVRSLRLVGSDTIDYRYKSTNRKELEALYALRDNQDDVLDLLDLIERGFDDIEHRIANMDKEHTKYVRATVTRMNYLLSGETDTKGLVVQLLNKMSEEPEQMEEIITETGKRMNLSLLEILSEKSLYKRRKSRKDFISQLLPDETTGDLDKDDILRLNRIQMRFSKKQIEEFIENNMEDEVMDASKINIADEEEFEKLILAYDYSTRKNSRYMVLEEEPEMVEKDGYRYPALRFVKRRV